RIERDAAAGRYLLKKAADSAKDQSYVLYSLTQAQLARTLFPLGEMTKPQVREIAEEHGFLNAKKRDSQDICFVPDGDYAAFIERTRGKRFPAGDFVDLEGNVLGRHRGSIRYTIGQRRGLGLALPAPLYVVEKNLERNRVVLGPQEALLSRRFTVREVNLIGADRLAAPVRVKVRVRYKQPEQWAVVEQTGPDALLVEFDAPQRAIAPGQAAVLYDGDYVLGGGTIENVLR
ncbi:MAG: tRNA 2-thiouridine(34) synthase MnmA, partial [Clostridiales bacterium]|nr:tRNA 2-thiouridine(34) synthase MnmA [Clostridiales bacterium]